MTEDHDKEYKEKQIKTELIVFYVQFSHLQSKKEL